MKTTPARAALVGLFLCVLPPSSHASSVTFNFVGTVNHVGDPFGLVDSLVHVGDPVQASLRYDTATVDGYAADPARGTYLSPGWLVVNINGLAFEHRAGVLMDILHHGNGDQELFQALVCCGDGGEFAAPTAWPASLPLFPYFRIGLGIGQNVLPYTLLSSDALPTSLDLALADFANGGITSSTADTTMYEIQFRLTGVPEPGASALLVVGLTVVLVRYGASRTRRHAHWGSTRL